MAPAQPGPSLESWTRRIRGQLCDILEPKEQFSDIAPTEAVYMSLQAQTGMTLVALAHLARDDEIADVRVLALVTLREFTVRSVDDQLDTQTWDTVSVATQEEVQSSLVSCLECDGPARKDKEVNTLCRTTSYILELNTNRGHGWPELENALRSLIDATATVSKQRLFYLFVAEYPAAVADMDIPVLLQCMRQGLNATDHNPALVCSAIQACIALLSSDDRHEKLHSILADILNTLPDLYARKASSEVSQALYALVQLLEGQAASLLEPYLPHFLPFVLSLLPSTTVDYLRQAAIEFVTSVLETLPQAVQQSCQESYEQYINTLLNIMTEMSGAERVQQLFWEGECMDEDYEDDETWRAAEDAFNRTARVLGPTLVLPIAYRIIPTWLAATSDWRKRYAALSTIGILAEHSRQEYTGNVDQLMRMVFDGMKDAHPRVVYAAVYTLAQFCSNLNAVVQEQFGEEIILSLLRIIDMEAAPERLVAYACSAFINLTSDLGGSLPQGLETHAGAILERLLGFIASAKSSADVRRRAMSASAQVARTLGDFEALSREYCEAILTALWPYLRSDVDADVKANALDCATLAASSVSREALEPFAQKLIASLVHIQQTHRDPDDPCTTRVLTGFVRIAEVLKTDFVPHVDNVIPSLLRLANAQVDEPFVPSAEWEAEGAEEDEDGNFIVQSVITGQTVKVNNATLSEKTQATQLLASMANSLGVSLTETGDADNTTGDWVSYAETILSIATHLLPFEYSTEIRISSAAMLPALVRAFTLCTRYPEEYNRNRIASVIPPLLETMASETDADVLSAQFAATSDVVLVAPHLFTAEHAVTFVNVCAEQIQEMRRIMQETMEETGDSENLDNYRMAVKANLEYMSSSLRAFVKTTGATFPIQGLYECLNLALNEQLGLKGEKEWALRLLCDLIQFASPNALAYTSGFLSSISQGLLSLDPSVRRTSAFAVGVAAANPDGLYTEFCRSCVDALGQLLRMKPDRNDLEGVLAYDNAVSAVSKIIANASTLDVSKTDFLPLWLESMPVAEDEDEMEPTLALLLDTIAYDEPAVSPEGDETRAQVLRIFSQALDNPKTISQYSVPLMTALPHYLARCPVDVRNEWNGRLQQMTNDSTAANQQL